ncbi:MAG: recombinase family protein [Lachnospiraceae bacterium]|nr:recombinase family protein [Lachnospiraceae bacterium]
MFRKEARMIYRAGKYLRLSKEDGDLASAVKQQSNSIENQSQYIDEFLHTKPKIQVEECYIDDGFSGVNFERPGFQRMLEDAKAGKIDCIIVKDLSRLGRNYIEAGKYIERIFPMLGIRFIAINDNYDSADEDAAANSMILPFKNLINDAYCRDISIKIRSHLEIKRKNGEFIGAFAVYGYRKGADRHRLAIDDYAAGIVKEIFRMKLRGRSQQAIADELNRLGVLSPADYKKEQGSSYKSCFQKNTRAMWTAVSVCRILKNEVYTGTLVQGKESTVNYKVKVRREKAPEEWCRVENAHDAIISRNDFEIVQSILKMDTRVSVGQKEVEAFSGMAACADCGCSMVRKKVIKGKIPYFYYRCSGNKKDKEFCSNHDIRADELHEAVKKSLQLHVNYLAGLQKQVRELDTLSRGDNSTDFVGLQAGKQEEDLRKYERMKVECYEDYKSGLLLKEEYVSIRKEMDKRMEEAKKVIRALAEKKSRLSEEQAETLLGFQQRLNAEDGELERSIVVRFIEKIYVYDHHRIEIVFRYRDEMERMANLVQETRRQEPHKLQEVG